MSIKNFVLNLIFPPRCLGCARSIANNAELCDTCEQSIPLHTTLFCGSCGLRLPAIASAKAGQATYKTICHKNFPYTLGAATDFNNNAVRNTIHALKFNYAQQASNMLGEYLVRYADLLALPLEDYLVIPIPLSPRRLRERGFNQSELIAKIFANRFKLSLECGALTRVKNTKPQSETKGLRERQKNIASAFSAHNPRLVAGRNIILIDDVVTSGATFLEAATTLKNTGAKNIIALAVARA